MPGPVLRVERLAKAFGATQALRDCTLDVRPGEVQSIMGENGSGKSTLVKILTGVHRPDAGAIELDGRPCRLRSPRDAQRAGVATVFQEVLVVPARSVLENVWLGTGELWRARVGREERARRARDTLAALLGEAPELDRPVGELSLSDQQACGIARALVRESRLLIFDEATSALDVETRDRLFARIRELSTGGVGVLFISHRMDEVQEISDRVTVMRSGETVGCLQRADSEPEQLIRLMTGADDLTGGRRARAPRRGAPGDVVLEARGLRIVAGARPLDFAARRGELIGLAGLEGHGQDAFLRALAGLHSPAAGQVVRHGERGEVAIGSATAAAANGIVYVPRQRRAEALFESLTIRENFALPTLRGDARAGLWSHAASDRRFAGYVERLRIVLGDAGDPISTLSGGNQQKVVLARWLAADPAVLLLNDPTRGIDLGAKRDVYDLLRDLAGRGLAVVMLSTEVDEQIELMDRVLVFREHALSAELEHAGLSREPLVASYFGRELHHDHA